MKYQFIMSYQTDYSVARQCQNLDVSRSGYYAWLGRSESKRKQEDARLCTEIGRIFEMKRHSYGSPRMAAELRKQGFRYSKNKVARLMHELGLVARKHKKPKQQAAEVAGPVAGNLLDQKFKAERINQKWVSDVTYIWTREGWLYLAAVLDLYSRCIVGWSMSGKRDAQLVYSALKNALLHRRPSGLVLYHSDQGSEYTSKYFQDFLRSHQIVASMSRKGNCYDNAVMESFWATLKKETGISKINYSKEEARSVIFNYIEEFYNRARIHSALGYRSPAEFEQQGITLN